MRGRFKVLKSFSNVHPTWFRDRLTSSSLLSTMAQQAQVLPSSDTKHESSTPSAETWTGLIQKSRLERDSLKKNGEGRPQEWNTFLVTFQPHLISLTEQLREYYHSLSENNKGKDLKQFSLSTRNALRFGLSCLSVDDTDTRQAIQEQLMVHSCAHVWMIRLLRMRPQGSVGESQIRLSMARLLCNLVTQNQQTSTILLSTLTPQPSDKVVEARIAQDVQHSLSLDQTKERNANDQNNQDVASELNWLDMVLSAGDSRDTLAALVATIYNSLIACSTTQQTDNDDASPTETQVSPNQFARSFAESGLFVSALVRHLVSSTVVTTLIGSSTLPNDKETAGDDATLWISNVFMYLLRHGYFPMAYDSIGSISGILPEHVAVLYCLRSELEQATQGDGTTSLQALFSTQEHAMEFMLFLAHVYSELRTIVASMDTNHKAEEQSPILGNAILLTIVHIMGCVLGVDDSITRRIRTSLGTRTTMVQELCTDLAEVYDSVTSIQRIINNKGRDKHELSTAHQEALIALVRTIGNLTFECRSNQDLVRTTKIPNPLNGDEKEMNVNGDEKEMNERSALHVILSTTSLSHTCFTLREWCLVAIRYLLQNNDANQKVLAELEAQQPVQSTELQSMGVRVEMDSKGDVRVLPSS